MKFLLKSIVVVVAFLFALWLGYEFDKWVYHLFTAGSHIGDGLKVILKVVIVGFTCAVVFALSFTFAGIVGIFFDAFFAKPKYSKRR